MKSNKNTRNGLFRWISVALVASLVTSCGGGGGGSGGGIGGTGVITVGTGLSEGTITGFGSVVLNGRRFDTDQATVMINNSAASTADLAVGMTVSAQVNFSTNTASRIEYFPTVVGRVESISGSTVSVLGQTVKMSSGSASNGIDLTNVTVGTALEVSGSRDKDDAIVATYITAASSGARTQITGLGGGYGGGNTFQFGGTTVSVEDFGPFPSFTPFNRVQVQGGDLQSVQSGSEFTPENFQVIGGDFGSEGMPIELEGIVIENQAFGFSTGFAVAGRPLFLQPTTRYELEGGTTVSANALTAGARVEVEGTLSFGGSIDVDRVIILASAKSKVTGVVEALHPNAATVTVLGIEIQTTERTRFRIKDGGAEQNYSTLRVGDSVGVRVVQNSGRLIATEIQTTAPNDNAMIEGEITQLGDSFIDIAGVRRSFSTRTELTTAGTRLKRNGAKWLPTLQVGDTVKISWNSYWFAENPADNIEVMVNSIDTADAPPK